MQSLARREVIMHFTGSLVANLPKGGDAKPAALEVAGQNLLFYMRFWFGPLGGQGCRPGGYRCRDVPICVTWNSGFSILSGHDFSLGL